MTEQEKVNYGRLANKVLIERVKANNSTCCECAVGRFYKI